MKKQSRSEAREILFSRIFAWDEYSNTEETISDILEDTPESETNLGYISTVLSGVIEKTEEIEKIIIGKLKKGWTITRISKASLVILKLAIYEMKYVDDVPPKVAINEAVELAKKYGTENDAAFVNGLLGNVYREL